MIVFQFDAEIVYWEGKEREKQFQLDFVAQEALNISNTNRINNEQVISFVIMLKMIA